MAAGFVGIALLITSLVCVFGWTTSLELGNGATTAGISAKAERHSPAHTHTSTFWTNFLLLFAFVTLLTTPTCFYVPQFLYHRNGKPYAQAAPASVLILAVPVAPPDFPGEKV